MSATAEFFAARDFLLAQREDYTRAYQDFRWPRLTHFNWALDVFDVQAAGNTRTALWLVDEDGGELKRSFDDMRRRSNQLANHLRAQGVKRGDALLLMLDNVVELWETLLAAIKLGAVIVPATTLLAAQDLPDRLQRGNIRHLVVGQAHTAKFDGLDPGLTRIAVGDTVPGWQAYDDAFDADDSFTPDAPTRADEPLLLYFTSGTTSRPKLVVHTHQSYPLGSLSTLYWIGLRPDDIHYNISSPGWAKHAWSNVFAPWNAGCTIFVYRAARFSAAATLDAIARYGVTTLCAPPTVWRHLIQEDLASYRTQLRALVGAGEPLNPEVIERVRRAWKLEIRDGYGQTETTAQIGNPPGQPMRAGSMGRPLPGYRIALLDADGQERDEGEIAIRLDERPVGLMQEYRDDAARMRQVLDEGYYRTGDVARRDADGYYWYIGRADDVFKSSDYRISPFELESLLIEHEAVAEAAVVPAPDELRLNVPKAYLTLRQGFEPDRDTALSILRFAAARLAPYQRIRRLEFFELPKTISGKIRRVELRAHAATAAADPNGTHDEYRESDFPELRQPPGTP
ncbi:AMP-binding protein [Salinicola endophyticus]|uniref:AMP-binding protein n=1 Tax=Salinicola endophyticus TaxID=1949083 RepID=A0AB74UCQ8_9GAMM